MMGGWHCDEIVFCYSHRRSRASLKFLSDLSSVRVPHNVASAHLAVLCPECAGPCRLNDAFVHHGAVLVRSHHHRHYPNPPPQCGLGRPARLSFKVNLGGKGVRL